MKNFVIHLSMIIQFHWVLFFADISRSTSQLATHYRHTLQTAVVEVKHIRSHTQTHSQTNIFVHSATAKKASALQIKTGCCGNFKWMLNQKRIKQKQHHRQLQQLQQQQQCHYRLLSLVFPLLFSVLKVHTIAVSVNTAADIHVCMCGTVDRTFTRIPWTLDPADCTAVDVNFAIQWGLFLKMFNIDTGTGICSWKSVGRRWHDLKWSYTD